MSIILIRYLLNRTNHTIIKASLPCHLDTITSSSDNISYHSQNISNIFKSIPRKNTDIDERQSAFKPIYSESTLCKKRSKSFNLTDIKSSAMFHPIIINSEDLKKCSNKLCGRNTSEGSYTRNKGKKSWLCNFCFALVQKDQYCTYCSQIYKDTSDIGAVVDGLEWIQCGKCLRWVLE